MCDENSPVLKSPSLQKTQELKAKVKTFKNILQEVGIQLSFNEEPHVLLREQALVLRDLEKMLHTSNDSCEEFISGLKILCNKEKHFRKVLMLTFLKKNRGDENTGSWSRNEKIEQESLMRTFSKVPQLQKYIFDILFNEIANYSAEANQDTSWLHLLLNPLSYLPYIDNPEFITTKLLDILEIASYPAQLEILNSIPEIIPDGQHTKTATELCKLLDDKDDLTGAIVDCLNALNLDCDIKDEVQDRILSKISGGVSPKVFPVLITFLLTNCKSQNLVQTLLKIRNAIDTLMLSSDKSEEKDSYKILVFNKLQHLAVSLKNISEGLLNMISVIKNAGDHKPVDYLILLMLHHTFPFKKKIIEAIIRKRVQTGLFKINQLEKMFENYLLGQLMKDYFNSIIEIGCSLIRLATEMCTREFSTAIFKLLFKQPNIESVYRRDILDNLIVLAGANDKRTVDTVLKIFTTFLDDKETLRRHTLSLMKLLEKLDSLDLKHVKQVFNILCSLTCDVDADETMTGMRDEIHMLVRKQLYSTKKSIKHRGIISAVVMARHLVNISTEPSGYIPKNITAVSALPPGSIKEAATLLELAYTCTANCPELTGLYYDQVTSMLMPNNHLDKYFMSWLYETTQAGFEQTYVVDSLPGKINDIELTMKYTINSATETRDTVGVNIGGLTLENNPKIILLAPHFRLLRVLHYRQNDGLLDGIMALLGCSIVMPNVEIDEMNYNEAKQVADCLFHCINWFREILNAFVSNKKKDIRNKVLKRLKNLLEVEQNLKDCILEIPDHKFPMSYFNTPELSKQFVSPVKAETKNSKKKLKSTVAPNQTTNISTTSAGPPKKTSVSNSNNSVDTAIFREIDTDVLVLIRYPLICSDDNISQSLTQKPTLSINELKFILLDYVAKLDTLSNEKDVGLQNLHMVTVLDFINDFTVLLPAIESHLKVLIKQISQLSEENDGRYDVPGLFTQHALDVKLCFGLIIKIYHLLFSWTGFENSSNLEILKDLLKSIRQENSQTLNSAKRLIVEFITNFSNLHEYCMELSHGVTLVRTIEALYSIITPNAEIQKRIVSVAEKLLSKQWFNTKGSLDSGKNANFNVDVLIKAYLSSANTKTISGLVGTLQKQAERLERKEDFLPMLASINKSNFHIFYNGLCSALLQRIKTEVQSLTNDEHIILWKTTTVTMQGLMGIAKAQETKTNLSTFLKKCIAILKVFLTDGIPVLELLLRSKPDDVVDIFKTMQTSTRFLHHLCCYSKLTKDSSLMAFVPQFRLTLETLVYRVKAALAANNCSSAFWMGNLKNRDLQGEDILSQSTTITETNEENSDEELPNDDSDTESISLEISSERNGSASSEVFD